MTIHSAFKEVKLLFGPFSLLEEVAPSTPGAAAVT